MKEIYNVDTIVRKLLADYPETRNSDSLLYIAVCKQINPAFVKMPFEKVLLERKQLGLPKQATVGRARRKIQEHNKALRGTATVTDRRYDNFKTVREYVQTTE